MKREIEKMRMKTIMAEAFKAAMTSPYTSIRENAGLKLKFLQEEYKTTFGEYSSEYIIESLPKSELAQELENVCNRYGSKLDPEDIITALGIVVAKFEAKK